MREVNFSIPNVNKASVNITTTLYDRRALDCTSTLPLINSLNHLAYLTTSSARIRDILTVDGGIERLICILKEGRSKDVMEMWKWSLAFQCVVNIGVRGSESVRTRVVEADMVPVIATLLDNYIRVMDKVRARADTEARKHSSRNFNAAVLANDAAAPGRSTFLDPPPNVEQHPPRRPPPPRIEIPQPISQNNNYPVHTNNTNTPPARMPMSSPPDRNTFSQETTHHQTPRSNHSRHPPTARRFRALQPLASAVPPMDTADGFGLRPVHDTERLPSMLPRLLSGFASQPESPTTPSGPSQLRNVTHSTSRRPRPVINQEASNSTESDDANADDSAATGDENPAGEASEPVVGLQNRMEIDEVGDRQAVLDEVSDQHNLTVTDPSEGQDTDGFDITHHSTVDGSIANNTTTQTDGALALSPNQTTNNPNSPALAPNLYALYLRDRSAATTQSVLTMMPRDEDVLMSLQLLAYVSKYCNLRSYFQNSHLVPKLKVDRELHMLDEVTGSTSSQEQQPMEPEDEYLLPDDVNIFPFVEKFTVRHHSKDMQYWACVVMRNLCRKDESRGGIRQCAYYKCGKWEEFQRQFAKCRRCRRTKYCSKDCQKAAWAYHRHWCHVTP